MKASPPEKFLMFRASRLDYISFLLISLRAIRSVGASSGRAGSRLTVVEHSSDDTFRPVKH